MKRLSALITVLMALVMPTLYSCKETKEFDDHANWKSRNQDYISKMASGFSSTVPQNPAKGDKFKVLSYRLDPDKQWGSPYYVYCEVLESGTGTESPQFTDSVRFNYRVRLIPTDYYPEGQVVDQSFKTPTLDPSVNIPTSFSVSGVIEGVTTALMHMHCGDYWKLYIPQNMAYGTSGRGSIPGYSTLIFEINLTELAHTGEELSPR
ncbi:MAG: FKBP-type peptidyl-prolyl cis-trans isomerase [Bacteroidaceae bacterium]|nr:FKBP-type peptidyl-prolyl cis-trans isomerase [Bacteroidaceae bacterium]